MSGTGPWHACRQRLLAAWRLLNGDAAYGRYLAHWQAHHAHEGTPQTRAAFYRQEIERRWSGVRRCC